ncbi:FlgB family protein [Cochlodiniinecator piscidefendens]|uniref:FlgB family protein n=1 Tax=Cochlodiniinecator piscidefendens TaxID=2715756 RepID=UPI00140C7545|nr:FlgB family protein [Cochlodiniinecator piscidefendens]
MLNKIELFRMAGAMTEHSSERHQMIARNIANADTPGYQARDLVSFSDTYERSDTGGAALRSTRSGHMDFVGGGVGAEYGTYLTHEDSNPNGNTVSLETEMMRSTENRFQHDMALSIYKTSLGILRSSLGRR